MSARFVRQVLLPEIGEPGQRRIGAASARVAGEGLAHEVAARYALGAGFAAVVPGQVDVDGAAPPGMIKDPRSLEILAGARAALAEIRRALREGES